MIYTGLAQQPARVDRSANVSRLIGQPRSATQPTHVGQAIWCCIAYQWWLMLCIGIPTVTVGSVRCNSEMLKAETRFRLLFSAWTYYHTDRYPGSWRLKDKNETSFYRRFLPQIHRWFIQTGKETPLDSGGSFQHFRFFVPFDPTSDNSLSRLTYAIGDEPCRFVK